MQYMMTQLIIFRFEIQSDCLANCKKISGDTFVAAPCSVQWIKVEFCYTSTKMKMPQQHNIIAFVL